MTPDFMETNLTKLGLQHEYNFTTTPVARKETVPINTYARVAAILKDKTGFVAIYKSRVDRVLKGPGYVSVFAGSNLC